MWSAFYWVTELVFRAPSVHRLLYMSLFSRPFIFSFICPFKPFSEKTIFIDEKVADSKGCSSWCLSVLDRFTSHLRPGTAPKSGLAVTVSSLKAFYHCIAHIWLIFQASHRLASYLFRYGYVVNLSFYFPDLCEVIFLHKIFSKITFLLIYHSKVILHCSLLN